MSRIPYDPSRDPAMQKPYVDIREWRERSGIRFTYVHGGFEGLDLRFSFYFPEKDQYEGRFFLYLPPAANHEDASQKLTGGDDRITFALTHGAYFVESNLGVMNPFTPQQTPNPPMPEHASAAVAEYSRKIAKEIYGEDITRPFGYVYGGSGGAYKTMACAHYTDAFDGAVPYVNGAPVSVPHNLTIRAHGLRVLRHKMTDIISAMSPGGSGDPYATLNEDEKQGLDDLLAFGFPKGALASLGFMKDGSLPMLVGGIKGGDPAYFEDYWTKPGYAGSNPDSDASHARIHHCTKVVRKYVPARGEAQAMDNTTGVDTNWQRYKGLSGALGNPLIEVESLPKPGWHQFGCFVFVRTGRMAGRKVYFDATEDRVLRVAEYFGCNDMMDVMEGLEPGDEVLLDNSDYIAATDYHLHALPDERYSGFDRCYDESGKPRYVQRDHVVNFTGAGVQTGDFRCKMIIEHTYCDESAFPYQADWYRRLAEKVQGKEEARSRLRIMYMDNALHDDRAEPVFVELMYVTNCGAVNQCLLDVVDWMEKGIEPPQESVYTIRQGEVIPAEGIARGGLQSVIRLTGNGQRSLQTKVGQEVSFAVDISLPEGAGKVTKVEWSFEGEKDYPVKTGTAGKASHIFSQPGRYIVCVRVYNERHGDRETPFTFIRNIDQMVVEVE